MLDGIGKEVHEDLLQTAGIRLTTIRSGWRRDPDDGRLRKRLGDVDGLAHDRDQIRRRDHELESAGLDPADVEEPLDEIPDLPGLGQGSSRVGTGLRGGVRPEVSLDELDVAVQGGHGRLELVTGRGHQPLQAEAHGSLGQVADGQHAAPGPVAGGQRLGHRLEPASRAARLSHGELHAESFASGGPSLWPVRSSGIGTPAASSGSISAFVPPNNRS